MPNQRIILEQQQLLATHRRTLAILLRSVAAKGGDIFSRPDELISIQEARHNIERIKQTLRECGVWVADEPGDSELGLPPPATALSAPHTSSGHIQGGNHLSGSNNNTFINSGNNNNYFYDAAQPPLNATDALNLLITLFNDANSAAQLLTANLNDRTNELAYLTEQVQAGALAMPTVKLRFETALVNTRADLINFTITLRQANGRYYTAIAAVERAINHMFDTPMPLGARERQAVQEFRKQLLVNEQQLHFALGASVALHAKLRELTTLSPHFKQLNAAAHEAADEIDQFAGWVRKNQQLLWRSKGMVDGLLQA